MISQDESERAKRWAELDAKSKALDRKHRKLDREWQKLFTTVDDALKAAVYLSVVVISITLASYLLEMLFHRLT